ncbi:sugar kinase [Sneathiella aquimaris]|uniref:sugar kinase n=1 Tax=Sneathiella aquimaris TaxID=2599305 RepID=UPI00146C3DCF|nr:sugar kinase [Sneathiella aquimaris]
MYKVLSFGEIMLEMSDVGNGLYRRSFAGDTFNMAYYLKTVAGSAVQASYMTALGNDKDSNDCIAFINKYGVSSTACFRDPDRTIGLFLLSNDEIGEKQYGYWRGQSAARHLFDTPRDLTGYDIVYFSGISAAITHQKDNLIQSVVSAKKTGVKIAYDFNYRSKLWSTDEACRFNEEIFAVAELVKISDEELELLYPGSDIVQLSKKAPEAEWVLTCSGGCVEIWQNGRRTELEVFQPIGAVVDSSAAGDAFIATFIASQLLGKNKKTALQYAHQIASQVVCFKGSIGEIDITNLEKTIA